MENTAASRVSAPPNENGEPSGAVGGLVPALSLPQGGGALRNIAEKFSANAFTGTGSLSVPIATSPSRGLGPQLAVSYDSGAGNGPFGIGWRMSVPQISRKTSRGLPRYVDETAGGLEADVFQHSDVEDLVPALEESGNNWVPVVETRDGYRITTYRPRVEGAFSRIQRWVDLLTGDTHWRTRSRDNVESLFGQSAASRIVDPDDSNKIFSWLLDETRDDKGNIVVFEYKAEDLVGANVNAPEEFERLREQTGQAQRYLKRIRYGNQTPNVASNFMFEVVLDYGEHDLAAADPTVETNSWDHRQDPFSSFRSGFDIRTRRLCQRVLMFHRFTELTPNPYLVRATSFDYDENPVATRMLSAQAHAYEHNGVSYDVDSLPQVDFGYSEAKVSTKLKFFDAESLEGVTGAIDGSRYRFVDLDGEGIPGLLTQQGGAMFYKAPLHTYQDGNGTPKYQKIAVLPTAPSGANLGSQALLDLDGDGQKALVSFGGPAPGRFERSAGNLALSQVPEPDWSPYEAFDTVPNVDVNAPGSQFIDLDGDGLADLLVPEERWFLWYPSRGKDGFGPARRVARPSDGRAGPELIYNDPQRAIFYADMTGDGLSDIVRIQNGSVVYWPNLGYGQFGRAITMKNGPRFDRPDRFQVSYIRLGDVDGSGTTDVLYFGAEYTRIYANHAGNGFADGERVLAVPPVDTLSSFDVTDLLGKGTACIVWSTNRPANKGRHVGYIDLMADGKPYLLVKSVNNMGGETRVRYAPSTQFYMADKLAGTPWKTRLPFPVQVVDRVEMLDRISGHHFVTKYRYHHGYFDGPEREFRGFGLVEQEDTEVFADFGSQSLFDETFPTPSENVTVPPVLSKTWFHTGAYLELAGFSSPFADEYYSDSGGVLKQLPDTVVPDGLTPIDMREGVRALRGRTLRSEVYALDGSADESRPYAVSEANFQIRQVQPREEQPYGVFFVHDRESLSYQVERDTDDPRVSQSAVLEVDEVGNVLRSIAIGYRRVTDSQYDEQDVNHLVLTEVTVDNTETNTVHRLGVPVTQKAFEVTGLVLNPSAPASWATIDAHVDSCTEIVYTATPDNSPQKRLLASSESYYTSDDLLSKLALGSVGSRALPYETRTMAFTKAQITSVFSGKLTSQAILGTDGAYAETTNEWWTVSGHPVYDASKFYQPTSVVDPHGETYTVAYDTHDLFVVKTTDPLSNEVELDIDYRVLAPWKVTDPNGNRTEAEFDAFGRVTKTAVRGKASESLGDTLADPTGTFEYDLDQWTQHSKPARVKARMREKHQDISTPYQERYEYTDGFGRTIMVKVQAEPGLAPDRDVNGDLVLDINGDVNLVDTSPDVRWVGNGRTIIDNKGNPIRQYEPYFSSTFEYEDEAELVEQGVSPVMTYDPLGRLIRTDFPDGSFARVEFSPWHVTSYDRNDTAYNSSNELQSSQWYLDRYNYVGSDVALLAEKRAAELVKDHADTPSTVHLDSLGRVTRSLAHNGFDPGPVSILYETLSTLDIQGNVLEVTDARGNMAETRVYGMLGQVLKVESELPSHTSNVNVGDRWALTCATGEPLRAWDDRNHEFKFTYDELRRPVDRLVSTSGGADVLLDRTVYGELLASPDTTNHRGRVYRRYDGGGAATIPGYDFKGNATSQERVLASSKTTRPDWTAIQASTTIAAMASAASSLLDTETFTASATFDALSRPLTATSPDSSEVIYSYNEAALLESVEVKHRGSTTATVVIDHINYDVKGRREEVEYGAGTTTTYAYDELTYRVTRIRTVPNSAPNDAIQSLHYHYDPVGNIVEVRDTAQQTTYFQNTVVTPDTKFVYDPLYRLIESTGREHATQGTAQRGATQLVVGPQPDVTDPAAMRRYTQTYDYDEVGNILKMVHSPAVGTGWTRRYEYHDDTNRLLSTSAPGDGATAPYSDTYSYDNHGSMTAMPHASSLVWNVDDEMLQADVGTESTYFQYADGERVRKYCEKGPALAEERIYIGPFEVFRKRSSGSITLEREALHISDDQGRMCLVETKTIDGTPVLTPVGIWRYQLSNHLGTSSTEVDENGAVISYEEFHAYGTSAYRAADTSITVSTKRYRYTGKERDDETGLYYHGARYYAAWLGRWTAGDPIGLGDGVNRWGYVSGNPVRMNDPTGAYGNPPKPEEVNAARDNARQEWMRQVELGRQEVSAAEHRYGAALAGVEAASGDAGALKVANNELRLAKISLSAANMRLENAVTDQYLPHNAQGIQAVVSLAGVEKRLIRGRMRAIVASLPPDQGELRFQNNRELVREVTEGLHGEAIADLSGAGMDYVHGPNQESKQALLEAGQTAAPDIASEVVASAVLGPFSAKFIKRGLGRLTAHADAHTLSRHGGSVTDDELMKRAWTGIAPDGHVKLGKKGSVVLPPISSAFHSDLHAVEAERVLREGPLAAAIAADPGKVRFTVSADVGLDVGRGFSRIGSSKESGVGGPLQFHPELTRAKGTFELDPSTGAWNPITIFPSL